MKKTSFKSNVDGITHTVTDKIIKMLKSTMEKVQTELDHNGNATHSLWFTNLIKAFQAEATHPEATCDVIKNKMVLPTLINLNLHETGLFFYDELQKVVKVTNNINPVVMKNGLNSCKF